MMANGLMVTLTRSELSQCRQAATGRWQLARASGVTNQRRDTDSKDSDVDYLGIRAELAFAKAFDIPYSVHAIGVDEGVDMFHGDVSIDVKATFHPHGKLLLKSKESAKADILVLVTATAQENVMCLAGSTSRAQFLKDCKETDFGKGTCWTMDQAQLKGVEALWLYLTRQRFNPGTSLASVRAAGHAS